METFENIANSILSFLILISGLILFYKVIHNIVCRMVDNKYVRIILSLTVLISFIVFAIVGFQALIDFFLRNNKLKIN